MSESPGTEKGAAPLVRPFPEPGPLLRLAYRELHIAANGTPAQVRALGDTRLLPRPWDPATCRHPELRRELWTWLDAVVTWLNAEYAWDVAAVIPSCWPHHPHLVHEIAVLADQRRHAGTALSSDPLEEWHRYSLPAFADRTRARIKNHCEDGHQPCPARGRQARHIGESSQRSRAQAFAVDVRSLAPPPPDPVAGPARLTIVDPDTGEITD